MTREAFTHHIVKEGTKPLHPVTAFFAVGVQYLSKVACRWLSWTEDVRAFRAAAEHGGNFF
jgi:hypothetical protein